MTTSSGTQPELEAAPKADATTEDSELRVLEAAVLAELPLPVDGRVIGEPVTVTRVRYSGLPRIGLVASCPATSTTAAIVSNSSINNSPMI